MDIDFHVVKVSELPPRFQPPSERSNYPEGPRERRRWLQKQKAELPPPLVEMLNEAASELTRQEEIAFLSRIESDTEVDLQDPGRTKDEWREPLVECLKKEANRFMSAAASLQQVE